ncbi:hypothetical protein HPB48_014593 [Haemaphysalis longicornis]|uniref:Anoctamin n=1 Tax=Haemaphysalis longicornis TaxID=44386 RepID=A0A9J6G5K8_HAELO|nr:hypothetical protein HPB48_014593 [Haemaphysalis longicornis]
MQRDVNALIYAVDVIKAAGDTFLTPFFAFTVCLWAGTVFLEIWKRRQASLAHRWNVDHFSAEEPEMPQFYGTVAVRDPITGELSWHYPMSHRIAKYCCSVGFFVMMGRSGLFGLGDQFKDRCGHPGRDTCMSLLSLQLLILMIVKPFPKFCYDVIWP